ncbi:MAG: hypothetical protein CSB55_01440 [Candidatus Cloacimonadota bacterium]|nr:MAG: hypothetical protein CSB55_01440 [Candidatus Cloacimonadota bacterium]
MRDKIKLEEIFALLEKCPVYGDNPTDCPIHNQRKYNNEEKKSWAEKLSFTEWNSFYSHHQECYANKMKNKV